MPDADAPTTREPVLLNPLEYAISEAKIATVLALVDSAQRVSDERRRPTYCALDD